MDTNIVKLAVDAYKGSVENYSKEETSEVLRQALVEANGGKTTLDYRAIRDGKCGALFSIVEQILSVTIPEGLSETDFFNSLVEYVNTAEGDRNEFVIENSDLFVVSDTANGTQAVRRQRLTDETVVPIPTTFHTVRIYEELNRVLAGRTDFNKMINKVSESFQKKILDDVYALLANATAADLGGVSYYPVAGAYSESALLDVIAHVEAASGGKQATIIGTKKALRNLAPSIQGADSKSDLYNMGYYGKFYGSPVIALPQRYKTGTQTFLFSDNVLTIIAGDDKPIKFVYEGDPLMIMGDPTTNADLTQEYFYGVKYGCALVIAKNRGLGKYEMTA